MSLPDLLKVLNIEKIRNNTYLNVSSQKNVIQEI
jgi:hypothetical protein